MTKIFKVRHDKDYVIIQRQLILVIERYFNGIGELEIKIYDDIINQKMIFRIQKKQNKPYEGTYLNSVRAKGSKESI